MCVELEQLCAVRDGALAMTAELSCLSSELKAVNERLWEIENEIRDCEARQDFGARFVELARAVYHANDRRCAVKRTINERLGSSLVEEKDYPYYKRPVPPQDAS